MEEELRTDLTRTSAMSLLDQFFSGFARADVLASFEFDSD